MHLFCCSLLSSIRSLSIWSRSLCHVSVKQDSKLRNTIFYTVFRQSIHIDFIVHFTSFTLFLLFTVYRIPFVFSSSLVLDVHSLFSETFQKKKKKTNSINIGIFLHLTSHTTHIHLYGLFWSLFRHSVLDLFDCWTERDHANGIR